MQQRYSWDAVTDAYERSARESGSHNKLMATSPFRSWVEISRAQIAGNYRAIKQAVGAE